jgi:CubicO group peptidase (beta-lactamase class C family)
MHSAPINPPWTIGDTWKFHREIDGLNWQFGGEKMRYNFLHRAEFHPHAVVHRTGAITPLLEAPHSDLARFPVHSRLGELPLADYIRRAPVNGIIIVQHGRILYECYPRMRPFEKHLLMSVTKVFVSTLVAILTSRGLVDPSHPLPRILSPLTGSGWDSVTVQDALDMASGIDAPEVEQGFTDPNHPYYQYEASLGWLPATPQTLDSTYAYVASLRAKDPPGQQYEYTSVNTFLLAWLAEHVTGLPLSELLTQEIWAKTGAEADGLLAVSKTGAPAAHGGLCAALRDVARFGLLFTPASHALFPESVIPAGYLAKIQAGGRREIFDRGPAGPKIVEKLYGEHPRHNVDQWDYVMEDGDFFKGGYGGQGLYISPARDLVIAYFGTPFDERMEAHELEWITRQIVNSGLLEPG